MEGKKVAKAEKGCSPVAQFEFTLKASQLSANEHTPFIALETQVRSITVPPCHTQAKGKSQANHPN